MSILLRHSDIPKYGHRIVILSDGHAYYEDFINPYVDLGEVVHVPPHGPLIDADVLAKRIKDEGRHQAEYYADRYAPVVLAYADCYGKVESAPTIIPASEEG